MAYVVDPHSWLLMLFLGASKPIDRIRIQKAMFLFAQRSTAPEAEKFEFVPYNYGPFSFEIYPALDALVDEGLLHAGVLEGINSPVYSLTTRGDERAAIFADMVPGERLKFLHATREFVLRLSFNALLESVYAAYPEFATKSVFKRG